MLPSPQGGGRIVLGIPSQKPLLAMLGLVAVLLAANLLVQLSSAGGGSNLPVASPAVAGPPSGNIVISDAPSGYIYTTNQEGDVLYVWKRDDQRRYFRRRFDTPATE